MCKRTDVKSLGMYYPTRTHVKSLGMLSKAIDRSIDPSIYLPTRGARGVTRGAADVQGQEMDKRGTNKNKMASGLLGAKDIDLIFCQHLGFGRSRNRLLLHPALLVLQLIGAEEPRRDVEPELRPLGPTLVAVDVKVGLELVPHLGRTLWRPMPAALHPSDEELEI